MRLLDPRFKYVPAARTNVLATWRKFGFKPTTEAERRSRLQGDSPAGEHAPETSAASRHRRGPNLKLAASE